MGCLVFIILFIVVAVFELFVWAGVGVLVAVVINSFNLVPAMGFTALAIGCAGIVILMGILVKILKKIF